MNKSEKLKSAVKVYRSFDVRLEISSKIELVFDKLTTADGLISWWTDDAEAEPRENGQVRYIWKADEQQIIGEAVYRKFERPYYFEVKYVNWLDPVNHISGFTESGPYPDPVVHRFELLKAGDNKTELVLQTAGISFGEKFDELYLGTWQGWINSLANLKSVCETGKDLRKQLSG